MTEEQKIIDRWTVLRAVVLHGKRALTPQEITEIHELEYAMRTRNLFEKNTDRQDPTISR